jgi:outer membrane protein OmpA-like peptidoglycan-associated protein
VGAFQLAPANRSCILFAALGELGMSKLLHAAGSIFSLALLLGGCGSESGDMWAQSSEALSTLTASSPAQGQVVTSSIVVFSGRSSAPAGSAVSVAATDARLVVYTCSATVRGDQTFSCSQKLADGGYTWTARIASQGFASAGIDFVTRAKGLAAPTIDQTPSPTRESSPLLTGTTSVFTGSCEEHDDHGEHLGWEKNGQDRGDHDDCDDDDDHDDDDVRVVSLTVSENGKALCTIANVSSRQWSCKVSSQLADGSHLLVATVKRGDSVSPPSNPDLFVVKTSIAPPTFDQVPTPSNVSRPAFSGRGEPAATLSVKESGTLLCQVTVSAGGAWSCTSPQLSDGTHTASASQQDAAGNVSSSVSVTFAIDTGMPGAPTLDAPESPTAEPRVTFKGTGEAGDQVMVADAIRGNLCSGRVDAGGSWSCSPANPLDDGDYVLTAFQVRPVGNRSGPSDPPRTLSVRTLTAPFFDPLKSPTRDNKPGFSGTLSAAATGFRFGAALTTGSSVAVMNGQTPLCSGTPDGTGRWGCSPTQALSDGSYLLVALLTDGKGHFSGPSMARAVVIDTTPPLPPVLDQLASPSRKHRPVLSGSAEALSAVTVTDADTGTALCEASANGNGAFSCRSPQELTAGTHRFSAVAADAAGNVSLPAAPVALTISDVTPPAPTIDSPADGSEVENSRPMLTGRTAAGTTVQVTLDGAIYAAQVAPGGTWTVLPSAALPLGDHHVTAAAIDADQNVSDPAASTFSTVESGVARGGCSSGGTGWPLLAMAAFLAILPKRRARGLAVVLAAALPIAARAQTIDVSLFRPASGGDGFAAVEGARPPIAGEPAFEVRSWLDYAQNPLVFRPQSGGENVLLSSRTGGWLGLQAHIWGPLSASLQMPFTYTQDGNLSSLPPSSRGPSSLLGGFGDLRLTPRLSLLRQETGAGIDLAAQFSLEFPTARAETLTDDGRIRAEALLALGRRLLESSGGDLDLLGNVFVRFRPPHEFVDVKTGNEVGLRAGLGYLPPSTRAWIPRRLYAELEGRTYARAEFAAGTVPAEWRLGATICPVRGLAIDLAGGGALSDGVGSPRARFLIGLGWSPSACNDSSVSLRPPPRPASLPVQVFAEATCPPIPSESPKMVAAAFVPDPTPDRDGDGVPDSDDSCPDQPGPVANYGCPIGTRQLVIVTASKVEILEQVRFDTGKATIKPQSHKLLDQVAAVLLSHPDLLLVQVEGHTDDRGSALRNIVLSQSRAESVAAYLEKVGVPAERLRAVGFGQGRAIATNTSAGGRAANRRVAFTVLQTRSRVIEAGRPPDS